MYLGPYVYEQKRKKINITINSENDTIDYQQVIEYFFRPDKSNGSEDDEITVINLPLVVWMNFNAVFCIIIVLIN